MSGKNHVFQVWEKNNQDVIIDGERIKIVATCESKAEAEDFARQQSLLKNDNRDCDCYDDYSYIIKRVHKNKIRSL